MFDESDHSSRKVVVRTCDDALGLGHDNTAIEHPVLALPAGLHRIAARVLESLGAGWNDFLERDEAAVGFCKRGKTSLSLTTPAEQVLKPTVVEVVEGGRGFGPEHLLPGLVRVGRSAAVRVFSELDASVAGIRREAGRTLRDDGYGVGAT